MIDLSTIQQQLDMKKRKEYLEMHCYSIWCGKDGFWRTYIPKGDGGRKLVKKKDQKSVEDAVIDYYKDKESHTFAERFDIWVERQRNCGRSDNTIEKYQSDYKRFFKGDAIESTPIKDINEETLSAYFTRLLNRKKVPYRALKALYGYLNSVFEKSIRDKVVDSNPCAYVDLELFRKHCAREKPKTPKDRILSDSEMKQINKKIDDGFENGNTNMARFAIKLSLYTGMRVGELAGLMWSDINYTDYEVPVIVIQHSEKYNRTTKEHYISCTKNEKIRLFPLTEEIEDVFKKVRKEQARRGCISEFVFADENGRVHASRISSCMRNTTMTYDFEKTRSIHAVRRTINSNLRCNGVSATVASSLLGHTERVNQNNYTYDASSVSEKMNIVRKATRIG